MRNVLTIIPSFKGVRQFRPQQFRHQNILGINFAPSNFASSIK